MKPLIIIHWTKCMPKNVCEWGPVPAEFTILKSYAFFSVNYVHIILNIQLYEVTFIYIIQCILSCTVILAFNQWDAFDGLYYYCLYITLKYFNSMLLVLQRRVKKEKIASYSILVKDLKEKKIRKLKQVQMILLVF